MSVNCRGRAAHNKMELACASCIAAALLVRRASAPSSSRARLARTALLIRTMASGPTQAQRARIAEWSTLLAQRGVRTFLTLDATAERREAQCVAFLDQLARWGIRVVVWDMDRTMSSGHCGAGLEKAKLDDYVAEASMDFVIAAKALAADPRFVLAVATGSDPAEYDLPDQSRATHILGPDLARALLETHCPDAASAFEIMIGFDCRLHGNRSEDNGKRHHMRAIAEHYGVDSADADAMSCMLLIDDSVSSLRSGGDGWRGVRCGVGGEGFRFADVLGDAAAKEVVVPRAAWAEQLALGGNVAAVEMQTEEQVVAAFPALLEPRVEQLKVRYGCTLPLYNDAWWTARHGRADVAAETRRRRRRSLGWGFHVEHVGEWWARWRNGNGNGDCGGDGALPIQWLWVVEDDVGFSGGDIGRMFEDPDVVGSDADLLHAPHSTAVGLEAWHWRGATSDAFERLAPPLAERVKGSEHVLRFSRALLDELHAQSSRGACAWSECSAFTVCAAAKLCAEPFPEHFIGDKYDWDTCVGKQEFADAPPSKLLHALKW